MTERLSFGRTIRAARVAKGLSFRALAQRVNVTHPFLIQIENDSSRPSEAVIRQLATQLELEFEDLLVRTGLLGEDVERYLARHPLAITLFRRIARADLDEAALERLRRYIDGDSG